MTMGRCDLAENIYIEDIARWEGQEVTIKGWLYNKTDKGRLQFLLVRDGTGLVQEWSFKKRSQQRSLRQPEE